MKQPATSDAGSTSQAGALGLAAVSAGYGRTQALFDVDLTVTEGAVVALLGANGAGKTTLLRVAAGLLRPSHGRIQLFGTDVTRLAPVQRARLGVCMVPEGRGIFRGMTVRDNLYARARRRDRQAVIDEALEAFPELKPHLKQTAGTLSGGQQQMLALARCYAASPKLVILDEVSMGLAPIAIDRIYEKIRVLADQGTSVLLVEQYVHRALEMASHTYVLTRGRLVFSGPSQELGREEVMAKYLGTLE